MKILFILIILIYGVYGQHPYVKIETISMGWYACDWEWWETFDVQGCADDAKSKGEMMF